MNVVRPKMKQTDKQLKIRMLYNGPMSGMMTDLVAFAVFAFIIFGNFQPEKSQTVGKGVVQQDSVQIVSGERESGKEIVQEKTIPAPPGEQNNGKEAVQDGTLPFVPDELERGADIVQENADPVVTRHRFASIRYTTIDGVEGHDEKGKSVIFKIYLLAEACHWAYKSVSQILLNNSKVSVGPVLKKIRSELDTCQSIIAVGMASQEEYKKGGEKERADKRADFLSRYLQSHKKMFSLSLGKYIERQALSKKKSALQRRIMIIGVTKTDAGVNLSTALKTAMENLNSLPLKPSEYSHFDLIPAD